MKQCGRCKQMLPLDAFNRNARQKDGLHRDCRTCKKEYQADWYRRHRDQQMTRTRSYKAQLRAQARELVINAKSVPCTDCGESYPWYVMDFDHLPEFQKVSAVSELVMRGVSMRKLKEEIAKCEVVCANCHRIRTFATRVPVAEMV